MKLYIYTILQQEKLENKLTFKSSFLEHEIMNDFTFFLLIYWVLYIFLLFTCAPFEIGEKAI